MRQEADEQARIAEKTRQDQERQAQEQRRIRLRERDALIRIMADEQRAVERAEAAKTRAAQDTAARRMSLTDEIGVAELELQGRWREADAQRIENQFRERFINAINAGGGVEELEQLKKLEQLRLEQAKQNGDGISSGPESSITSMISGIDQLQNAVLGKEDQVVVKLEAQLAQAKQRDALLQRIEVAIKNGANGAFAAVSR